MAKELGAGIKAANSNKWRAGTNPYYWTGI